MLWQTLLICLFTVCWAVSHYSGHMGRCGVSPELCTVLCHFTACMTEYANHAYRREQPMLVDSSAFGYFGRMVWQRPALLELAAQMLPFKYLVDFKGATLPPLLSKSGVIVCHKVTPFASTADHAPEMKGHLGYIWNRIAVTYICCSCALLNVKLHPICSQLFRTSERWGLNWININTLKSPLTVICRYSIKTILSIKEIVMDWSNYCFIVIFKGRK